MMHFGRTAAKPHRYPTLTANDLIIGQFYPCQQVRYAAFLSFFVSYPRDTDLNFIRIYTKMNYNIQYYLTEDEVNVAGKWLRSLRDPIAKAKITKRISRLELGNFGDHKPCREGVWEMRVDEGPGYRVDYAIAGKQIILLLCGGSKTTQDSDIENAIRYWEDWNARHHDDRQKTP